MRRSPIPQLSPTAHLGRDRGQVLPFAALVVLVVAGSVVLLTQLSIVSADRARARTAADAAALAAADGGLAAAERVARANGGQIEAYQEDGCGAQVTVRVGRARASSRAQLQVTGSHPVHSWCVVNRAAHDDRFGVFGR